MSSRDCERRDTDTIPFVKCLAQPHGKGDGVYVCMYIHDCVQMGLDFGCILFSVKWSSNSDYVYWDPVRGCTRIADLGKACVDCREMMLRFVD